MEDPFEEYGLDPENDLPVNPEELDVELIVQHSVFRKYHKALNFAEVRVKQCEENIKTIRSELILDANEDPTVMGDGIKKATGPLQEAYYRTDKEYRTAKQTLIKIENERDEIKNAAQSAYNRRYVIEGMMKAALMGYFATPQTPRELKHLIKKAEEKTDNLCNSKVRRATKRMKRTTRK